MDDIFLAVKVDLIMLIKKDGKNGDNAVNIAKWMKYNKRGVHQKF